MQIEYHLLMISMPRRVPGGGPIGDVRASLLENAVETRWQEAIVRMKIYF